VLLLALVGCLNPQPDPFPQNAESPSPQAPAQLGPNDVQRAPGADDSAAAATPAAPATPSGNTAAQPPAPESTPAIEGAGPADAGAPAPDAGADGEADGGVPANG
jgi:hypothetical protein